MHCPPARSGEVELKKEGRRRANATRFPPPVLLPIFSLRNIVNIYLLQPTAEKGGTKFLRSLGSELRLQPKKARSSFPFPSDPHTRPSYSMFYFSPTLRLARSTIKPRSPRFPSSFSSKRAINTESSSLPLKSSSSTSSAFSFPLSTLLATGFTASALTYLVANPPQILLDVFSPVPEPPFISPLYGNEEDFEAAISELKSLFEPIGKDQVSTSPEELLGHG